VSRRSDPLSPSTRSVSTAASHPSDKFSCMETFPSRNCRSLAALPSGSHLYTRPRVLAVAVSSSLSQTTSAHGCQLGLGRNVSQREERHIVSSTGCRIGKSRLALRHAKVSLDLDQYSHIFWVSASSIDKLDQGFAKTLDLVGITSHKFMAQKLTVARLRLRRHGDDGADWILVFDNVDRNTLGFLRTHLPRNGGNIFFTTRIVDVVEALVTAPPPETWGTRTTGCSKSSYGAISVKPCSW
jgi:hypothetical protein